MKGILTKIYIVTIIVAVIVIFIIAHTTLDKFLIPYFLLLNGLATIRSHRLENYLRKKDNLESVTYLEHLGGLLNSLNKMIGLFIIIRPIINNDDLKNERQEINRWTYFIYLVILLGIVIVEMIN